MSFSTSSWLRGLVGRFSGPRSRSIGTSVRHKGKRRHCGTRLQLDALEPRVTPATGSFEAGAYLIDMGQPTQTVANALKPYGLVYDMVTNFKVPVNWAINPAKTTFRLDAGNPIPFDFTATITTGTKSYAGGSFIIDAAFLTPAVIADINTWKAQGVVVDTLAAPLTTEIYGQVTSFPLSVLDAQNGKLAIPYFTNAGVPASAYHIGFPTDLDHCDDVFILTHADPDAWPVAYHQALYDFVVNGGGLWAGCHSISELENLFAGTTQLNFLSNGGMIPFGSHADGTPPYSYNSAAANDPIMQIMNRLDAATQNGSEQIYVPNSLFWRSTTTVAVFDPDHPDNPTGGTSPFNDAAVVAYGNAYGDPSKGLVMYEGGHSLAGTAAANIAAQRALFNFILTEGIIKAPKPALTIPTIVAGQTATLTATISGGSGSYSYQWVSSNGGVFSVPAGTATAGSTITTQYLLTGVKDTVRLLVTDTCGRRGISSANLVDPPPTIDLDANNSSDATGADYKGYFTGGAVVPAADPDTRITDNGTVIHSATIKLTTRPDGTAETLLIDTALATSLGINVASDGKGGFILTGTATLAQYQQVISSLQYTNSLAFPNSTDRVVAVTVNDGISNSNTAVARLSFLGGGITTADKQLYLSDPAQGMDRVDPAATGDTTTSSVAVVPVVSPNSTGMATWTNSATKNLVYRPWNLTGYGTQGTTAVDGGSYSTMTSAASAKRNEAIVVGVTTDRHVSGAIWNGSAWTPIAINIGGTVKQKLGAPSQSQWWGAAVAYETNTGRAVLVWNTGTTLNYSIWNGISWTAAATIPAYTGVEPRQIRIASNPMAGSNEIVITVTDKNEVDRALVWNGSMWGNQIQLDNNGGHNFTDVNVAYEQQSGRALVVYASGTTGDVGYRTWNGSAWSSAATIADPTGSNNYAQWTVVAGDPHSNRIVLGVESNGKDAWMNVWSGSAWGTSTLGVQDGVDNNNNLEIAVAFESTSGEALAAYQNNENTNTTELQFRTFTGGAWSAAINFGAFANKVSRSITLDSNPYSDQVMLLVNDDAKDLRSDLWTGSSFAAPIQLETNTNTQNGQPFSFFWDRYLPGTVTTETTFTQTSAMTAPFVMPTGAAVKVTTYIQLLSGTLPVAPKLAASLSQAGTPLVTLPTPPTATPLGSGFYKLEWTGSIPNNETVPSGGQISLTLSDFDSTYSFNILYDSNTYPSLVQVATATAIAIDSLGVYEAHYPGGSPIITTAAGQPAYVRFTVSDPFGAADINSADLVIKNSSGGTVVSTTLTDTSVVASTAGSKTYEYAWVPPIADTFTIIVTVHEGTEGVTATDQAPIVAIGFPDLVVSKADGGITVNAGGSVAYTINYSNAGLANATGVVLTEFLPAGATFNAAGSTAGWVAVGSSEFLFPVGNLAPGASGSVVFAVTVPSPVPAGLELVTNTVQITHDGTHGADTNPANNLSSDSTRVNAAPDLVITKTDGGTSTLAGGIVLYQITYTNVGTQNANGVLISETPPANTTFNSTYSFGAWGEDGGEFELAIGDLPVGASGTVTVAVTVASPLPPGVTQLFNTVSIEDGGASGPDLNPANNAATDTTPIVISPEADLQITKTDGQTTVQPGSVVTSTITVTNAGPNAVTGAAFTDNVPASLSGVSYLAVVSGGATVTPGSGSGNAISGTLNLPTGATVTYTISGTLDRNATGTLTNVATALPPAGALDPNTGNNTAIDSDPIVPVSDLSLAKGFTFTDLDGSGTLTPGDQIVFGVTVTNSGPDPARNVAVEDLLPNGYTYVSDDAAFNGGTYSQGTGLWTVGSTLGATAPTNTAVLRITAIVGPGGTYTNVAQVHGSDSFDPDSTPDNDVTTEDDFATVTPIVQPKSDLSLDKIMALTSDLDANGFLSIGDRVTFTLTLHNLGPDDAANVHVADFLPAGYSLFGAPTSSQGTYTSATGDWNVGAVSVLSTPTLTIVATVVGSKPASAYVNYAQVSSSGSFDPDSTPGDNSTAADDDASTAPLTADLSVTKTAALASDADDSGTLTIGDDVVFTLTVTNDGPDFATGVQVTDLLASGFTYVSDDSPSTYDPVTGVWNVDVLAPGATATLNITATVDVIGSYANTAQVSASQTFDPDSTPNNNVASEDDQASITLTPGATAQPPVAVNDSSLHNSPGPVTLNVTNNDTDPNLDLAVGTVDLNPGLAGQQTTLTVAGQGTWTVDSDGNVNFTPQAGFTHDPTPISYAVQDAGARISNQATITIDYVPVATNDSSSGNTTGTAVTVAVLDNDTTGDATVPSTVQIVGTPAPGVSLVVPGEGTWSVNTATGAITFTPAPGFTGDPTPIQYTVQDNDGNTSNPATVTVDYVQNPPVAVNDSSLNNQPGPVSLNVTGNDTDPNNDVDPSTVDLDPATAGQQTTRVVPGEGFWQVDGSGNVTFFPNVGFTGNPTPINYNLKDRTGLQSNNASITITYQPQADLSLAKTVSNATPNVGDTITFTVTVTNHGPNPATGVVVSDALPAGLTLVLASTNQGTYNSANGVWSVGTLNNGASAILLLRARVDSPAPQTNTATVTNADQFDPNTGNNTDSAAESPEQADLTLTKSVSNARPNVGDSVTFTVTLTNSGPNPATGVTITDLLPAGLTFVSDMPSQGTYNATTGVWSVGTVNPATPATLLLTALVSSSARQTNTATVSGADQFDPNPGNNSAIATETPQSSDLSVTKTVSNSTPNVGDTITFTVTLTNAGPDAATGIQIADVLPAGLSFVTATPSLGTYAEATGVWTVGTLANAPTATLTLRAVVASPTPQTNTATISGADQFDPNTANNSASATETPQLADLALTKTVSDPAPNVGDQITFTVTLTNNGPTRATNVRVKDLLPAGLVFVSAAPSQGTYTSSTGIWNVGALASGAQAILTLNARVTVVNPTTNSAGVTAADQFDPDTGNNTAGATVVPLEADLAVTKVVSDASPSLGEVISYTITLNNLGPDDATGVSLRDRLPAGLAFVSASQSQGSYDPATGIWIVGTLANGASATLVLDATVTATTPGTNVATITAADQFDPETRNNSANAPLNAQQVDLVVGKSVNNSRPNQDEIIIFTVSVTNRGPNTATNVSLSDIVPSGLTVLSAIPSQGTYDPATGIWTIGAVTTTVPATLQIDARVITSAVKVNRASIIALDQPDANTANNSDQVTVTPRQADLVVNKSVNDSTPDVGDIVTFTIQVTNHGPDAATGVQLTDLLPAGLTFVSAIPTQGGYDPASGIWTIGALNNGVTATLLLRVQVATPAGATNTAAITAEDQFDTVPANNSDSAATMPFQADLSVTKTVDNPRPNVGDVVTFIVTLRNSGPDAAQNVQLTDLVPAGLSFVSAIPSSGSYDSTTGTWSLASVANGATATLQIRASVDAAGIATNTATIIGSTTFDPDPVANQSAATVTPQQADLVVTKTVDKPNPNVGDTVAFTVTVTNHGPDAATNVQVTDLLPSGLTFVGSTPSQGSYASATGVWTVGTVASGGTATLVLRATVAVAGQLTNTAAIGSADQFDPDTGNNRASAIISTRQADLVLGKSVDNPRPNVGDTITFTILVRNAGPDVATNVQVTDVLPPGLMFVSATPTQGTYDSATGLWTVGSLAVGGEARLTIMATATSPNLQLNVARVTGADQFDPDTANNVAQSEVDPQEAELVLTKSVDNPRPNVGDTVTFDVTLENLGPNAATGVQGTDNLPPGVTYLSATPDQGTYVAATGVWDVGTFPAGETLHLIIRATVISPSPSLNLAAITDADQPDPNPQNNQDSATIIPQQSELAVFKSVDNSRPNVGDTVSFTITVSNLGQSTATNVTLTDLLPTGLSFVSAVPSQGTYNSPTGLWSVGTVTTGAAESLVLQATVTSPNPAANIATVTRSDQFDPNSANNEAQASVTPQQADLQVLKSVDNAQPNVGDIVTFTITLTNFGADVATGVVLTDLLPAGLAFVSAAPDQGSYVAATGVWSVGTVIANDSVDLILRASVTVPGTATNTATVTRSDQFDPNVGNDAGSASVTPRQADLVVTKGVDNPQPNVGDLVTFTVTVTNLGPDAATGVSVNDALPVGLAIESANPSQGTYDATTGVWTVGTIPSGGSATLELTARVTSPVAVSNTASIGSSAEFDSNPGNNAAAIGIQPPVADVEVTKVVNNPKPSVGETITFTVTVTNNGPDTADGVVVTDFIPVTLQFVAANATVGTYDPATGTWTVGTFASGNTAILTITAKVTAASAATNLVTVRSLQFDPDLANNAAAAAVVPPQADLRVAKSVSASTVVVGQTVVYSIAVRNLGPDPATNVVINDRLPAGLAFVSVSQITQGIYDPARGRWTVGTLAPGAIARLRIVVRVNAAGTFVNVATATLSEFDPVLRNNRAAAALFALVPGKGGLLAN